jgi:hypothetical protein
MRGNKITMKEMLPGVAADLSFAVVQKAGLAAGVVDTKVCAINDVWSGLRFVIRLKDRVAAS